MKTIEELLAPETDARFVERVRPLMERRARLLHCMSEQGEELVRLHATEACADNPESIEAARELFLKFRDDYNRADDETLCAETERLLRIARGNADDGSDETVKEARVQAVVFGKAADRLMQCQKALLEAGL